MDYDAVAKFAQTYGLIYLFVLFIGVLIYALWPGNRRKFKNAAEIPLKED